MSIQYKNSDILSVPNVAALFTLKNLADNQLVQTQGYSTEGVGSNLYRYDSGSAATIDGGFVLPGPGGTLSFSGTTFDGDVGDGGRFIALDQSVADVTKFGALTSASDNYSPIQRAINSCGAVTARPAVVIPGGKYNTLSTLTVTSHNVCIMGLSSPSWSRGDDSSGTTRGSTIRYSGTGTALLIGVSPGSNGTFIENTRIEHLRIEVDNNTSIAMRVWHSAYGYFNDIVIFGMKGSANIGLQVEAGISNIYERIEVNGIGQTVGASTADYAIGLRAKLGYLNDLATTTTFRRCYFHYCYQAALIDYAFSFEDCVFEASDVAVTTPSFTLGEFSRCWFEANTSADYYFGSGTTAFFTGCHFNSYSRQSFFVGAGADTVKLDSCTFQSAHASPLFFSSSSAPSINSMPISACTLPANIKCGTTGFTVSPGIFNSDMNLVTYTFIETGITGTNTIAEMTTSQGLNSFVMPRDGHIVGLRVRSDSAMSGGTWDIAVKVNGVADANVSYPAVPVTSSTPYARSGHAYESFVNTDDELSVYFHTSSITGTLTFVIEVDVLLGSDGRQ